MQVCESQYKSGASYTTEPVVKARGTSPPELMALNKIRNVTSNGTALNSTELESVAEEITQDINSIYTPILVVIGTLGNLISLFVFYATKLHLQSTSQYLSALAICDTLFLLQLIPPWLNTMQYTNMFTRQGPCQLFVYISYVTSSQSTWLVVAFTVERYIAVSRPLQRNVLCTMSRSRYVITGILIMGFVVNIPLLRYAISKSNECSVDYHYMIPAARFNVVDTALAFTVPLIIIVILNSCIMHRVWKMNRQQRAEEETSQHIRLRTARNNNQYRVTRMLLFVSSVFVILNLPAYVMRMISYAYNLKSQKDSGKWGAFQQITLMFFNTNYGINFILYCLSGQNFRRALIQCIPWLRRTERRRMTDRMAPTSQPGRASSISTSYVSGTEAVAPIVNPPNLQRQQSRDGFLNRWRFNNNTARLRQNNTIQLADLTVTQETYDDLI